MTVQFCYPDTAVWVKPTEPTLSDPVAAGEQAAHDKWASDIELAEAFAWRSLQILTGGRIAVCEVTVRPCRKRCRDGRYLQYGPPFAPIMVNGGWINVWCSHRGTVCACTEVNDVVLPGPVARVTSVVVDGVELDPDDYYVLDGNRLVRTDGGAWPLCQDMNKLNGEGTFLVTYLQGQEADQTVNAAAGVLANEMYLSMTHAKGCRLPKGTTQVTRQGVTYEIVNDLFATGRTGLYEVDIVVAALNPHGLKQPPRIFSLDAARTSRPTAGRWPRG